MAATSIATMKKDLRKKIKTILSDLPEAAAAAQCEHVLVEFHDSENHLKCHHH